MGDEGYTSLLSVVIVMMMAAVFGGIWLAARVDSASVGREMENLRRHMEAKKPTEDGDADGGEADREKDGETDEED